jgi:hypothetical protein
MIYYHVTPGWTVLLTPIFVLQTVLLVMGSGMLLAALNVRYRDVKYAIPFVVQIGLFVTPIIYPLSFFPVRAQGWFALNPMAGIVEGFRSSLLGTPINWNLVGCSWLITLVFVVLGTLHFRTTERAFLPISSDQHNVRHIMTETITVENLCKRYELGALQQETQLREHLVNFLRAPFRRRHPKEILWAARCLVQGE